MPFQGTKVFPASQVPELYLAGVITGGGNWAVGFAAGGSQESAVGRKGGRENLLAVPRQGSPFLAGGHLPELDGLVPASCCQSMAIGGKGNKLDNAGVSSESDPFLACGHVPEFRGLIAATRRQGHAVG